MLSQITQTNKFAISLQYLKKEVTDEVGFLQISYKLILWFLKSVVKHSQSSQNKKFAIFLQYIKNEVRDEVIFLLADKNQSFLQVDFNTLVILSFLIAII